MDLLASLKAEFPKTPPGPSDEYIENNPDPIDAEPKNNWLVLMPAYMSWCIRSPKRNELLVVDHTINALAEFGRFTQSEPEHMNFRSVCNPQQKEVVRAFLRWCLNGEVLVLENQVERSLKRWHDV